MNELDRLNQYIISMFANLLDVSDPPAQWVEPWVERGRQLDDPIALFNEFIAHPANSNRRAREKDAATRWPTGHFYSPVLSKSQTLADWQRISSRKAASAVDMRQAHQLELLKKLSVWFPAIPFGDLKTPKYRYHYDNPSYNFGDALIYWSVLAHFRPKSIIEIGSGFTSALALDAIDALALPTRCTFIDPFPEVVREVTAPMNARHVIIPKRVQDLDPAVFDELGEGDLLFIDSSHVVKTGSDVHFELTEILPRLKSGVLIHFHDVFYPFEYPKQWVVELNHSWNEVYFLHAFLMFNNKFQIEFFNHFIAQSMRTEFVAIAPNQAARFLLNPGGGLWIRKI